MSYHSRYARVTSLVSNGNCVGMNILAGPTEIVCIENVNKTEGQI